MPDTGVHVVIVGHNLEAKCDVANALTNQRNLFRPFSCRRKIVIKSRSTVIGKHLYIVATPDLGTPSWAHLEKDLTKFKTKVFLYVQDNDCIDSDDAGSVEMLQKRFSEKSKSVPVVCIQYNTKLRRDDSFSSLDGSFREDFSPLPIEDQVIINKRDSFADKSEKARKIMKLLIDSLKKDKSKFEGRMAVDDRKSLRESMSVSSNSQDSETDVSVLDSVTISDGIDRPEEEEFRSLELPCVDNNDWDLFRKTLKLGRARSNHVRVNIVGNQGAGKTSLVKRLQEIDIKCPDNSQKPTEGLEINQVTTRCAERDGIRYWETKYRGYEQELNLQRMAFALQHAEDCINEQQSTKQEIDTDAMAELELGSEECEEIGQVETKFQYEEHVDIKQKELYLQKVKRWKENSREERMYVSYWDFAGQATYYSTHQAFMAPSAVYVLVIDLTMDLKEKLVENLEFKTGILKQYTVEETVKFWISSIKAYTRDEQDGHAPFIVVGTHKDKVTTEQIKEKFSHLRQVLRNLTQIEFVAIDNTCPAKSDTRLNALKNKILDLGLGVIDEEIPAQWINLEYIVLQKKNAGKSVLSFADIQDFDAKSDMPMRDPGRIEAFLEHEHRRGWLMHFCHVDLKDIIILDPTLLAGYFNVLLRKRPSYELPSSGMCKDGIVHKAFILDAAAHAFNIPMSEENLTTISKILTHLHIMYHFEEDKYFLPCLLPHRDDRESLKDSLHHEKAPTLKLSFADAFVPPAFFHLLIAALNEEQELKVYKKKDIPRIYNLFTCFCFQRDTLWLEVYWHECSIFFDLKNYSTQKKINEPGSNKLKEAMDIIQNKIDHILSVYRQDNVQYIIEIECPKHRSTFVDLQKAIDEDEVMCTDADEVHAVSWSEISKILPWSPYSCEGRLEKNQNRPSDKDLGRLARHLSRENATSLSSKLKLPQGNVQADRAMSEWESSFDMQRLSLLCTWKEMFPEETVATLLKLLTKRKDYDIKTLQNVMQKEIEHTEDYGLNCSMLDCVPPGNKDLLFASDCIGSSYTFLMLELGLTFQDIEVKRIDNLHALRETIFKLFETWRQRYDKEATPRTLLDAAKFLGMNTAAIASKLRDRPCT
ncbi:uncharacterized protein LOC123537390 [Mercenaria mercenaria]|uniref:uncharacterized protein LOC123537390 n=1 Tax=Mercenaria mercenaria TaxID=6596 RepID=UPI00234FA0EF|nr:uncharacterized protein LOC123537390 [Mercenaria mercenaria]